MISEVKRLEVRPGDVLVVRIPFPITSANEQGIKTAIQERFPGHEVIVIDDGADIGVISKAEYGRRGKAIE